MKAIFGYLVFGRFIARDSLMPDVDIELLNRSFPTVHFVSKDDLANTLPGLYSIL